MVKDQISFIRNRAQKITPKSGTISRFSLKHAQWYQYHHLAISISSAHLPCNTKMAREEQLCPFVPTARTEGADRARACRSAPDALVGPVPVAMLARRREWTRRSVRRRPTPLAVLLVINMLMLLCRTIGAGMSIAMIPAGTDLKTISLITRRVSSRFNRHDKLLMSQFCRRPCRT